MRSSLIAGLTSVCASALILFAVSASANSVETIQQKCTVCHTANRICLNLGVKSEAGWKATVEMMVARGANLKPEQVDSTIKYLFTLKPGTNGLCD